MADSIAGLKTKKKDSPIVSIPVGVGPQPLPNPMIQREYDEFLNLQRAHDISQRQQEILSGKEKTDGFKDASLTGSFLNSKSSSFSSKSSTAPEPPPRDDISEYSDQDRKGYIPKRLPPPYNQYDNPPGEPRDIFGYGNHPNANKPLPYPLPYMPTMAGGGGVGVGRGSVIGVGGRGGNDNDGGGDASITANENVNLNNKILNQLIDKVYKTKELDLVDDEKYLLLIKERWDESQVTLNMQMDRDRENRKKQETQRRLDLQKQFNLKFTSPLAPDHIPTDATLKYLGIK